MTAIAAARACVSAPCVVDSRNTRSRVVTQPTELHHFARPASADTAEAVAKRLAEASTGRASTSYSRLRTAEVPAEAGDHLVEDEQRAVLRRQSRAAPARKPGAGSPVRRGLEHDAGDLAGVGVEQRVGRSRDRCIGIATVSVADRGGNAGGHRGRTDEPVVVREERMVGADRHHRRARCRRGPA